MEEITIIKYKNLVNSLRLAALTYEEQVSSLPDFVDVPDEIALTFSEAFLRRKELVRKNLITKEALELLNKLNTLYTTMSGDEGLWNLDKLKMSNEWEETRNLAKRILKEMGEGLGSPDF